MAIRDMKFRATLDDQVSKGLDNILKKIETVNSKLASAGKEQADTARKAADRMVSEAERAAKGQTNALRQAAQAEKQIQDRRHGEYEKWWEKQFAAQDAGQKKVIALQRNSISLEERMEAKRASDADRARNDGLKKLEDGKALAARIERQAAQAEASLVLDKFERRIAVERVKHQQILAGLQGNHAAIEAETRRHAAVVNRVQMDKANFSNTPFQKMLESFNKLNNGLGKALPAMTMVSSAGSAMGGTMAAAAGSVGAFGGVLSSVSMGPVGLAIAAVGGLSAGLMALIDSAEKAASLRADVGVQFKDPEKAKQALAVMERFEKAKANVGKNFTPGGFGAVTDPAVMEMDKASKEWKAIAGVRAEDENIWNAERLRRQVKGAAETTDAAKQARKDAKTAQQDQWAWEREVAETEDRNRKKAEASAARAAERKSKFTADVSKTEEIYAKREQDRKDREGQYSKDLKMAQVQDDPMAKLKVEQAREIELAEHHGDNLTDIHARHEIERNTLSKKLGEERLKQKEVDAAKEREIQDKNLAATGQFFQGFAALAAQANMKDRSNRLRWKTMAISEAVINTGRSIMQTVADPSVPFYAKIAAGLGMGAFGLAQVNAIKDQQFYTGGYTGGGNPNEPAGIVHKEEYVVDHQAVRRAGGPAGVERALQGGSGFTHTGNVSIHVNLPAGATPAQAREAGAAAAEGYMRTMRKQVTRSRDAAYMGVLPQ